MLESTNGVRDAGQPDILLIGHVTCDLVDADRRDVYRIGGTVSFASTTAVRLGRRATVVTRAAPDTDLSELPEDIDLHVLPSPVTTTFANVYTDHGRIQFCFAQADPIAAADIGDELRRPQAVLLGPLVGEIEPDIARIFAPETLVAAVPQGWMRSWDETGRVHSKPWENADTILPHLDVLVLSLEDIDNDMERLRYLIDRVPLLVLTEYHDGSTLFRRDENGNIVETKIPPRPANEVDPTGAGDIFATAFVIRLQESGDPVQSARFANVTASFGVEQNGVAGIPTRAQVVAYMDKHPFVDSTV